MLEFDITKRRGAFELRAKASIGENVTGVLGPSGSGKTTLLETICGLTKPDRGHIRIGDELLFDSSKRVSLPPEKRRIGCVFQAPRLFPHMTVDDNLLYGWRRVPEHQRRFRVAEIIDLLQIGDMLARDVAGLSGGEAQRVAIGRAILISPRLLVLDEPLQGLDAGLKRPILKFLRRINAELQIPMIYVTHSTAEIQALGNDVMMLDGGRVVAEGTMAEMTADAESFELASRLGFRNHLHVEISSHDAEHDVTRANLGPATLQLPRCELEIGETGTVTISPRDVMVARQQLSGVSARNALPGSVAAMTRFHDHWIVSVDVGQPICVELTASSVQELSLEVGSAVWLILKTYSFDWV